MLPEPLGNRAALPNHELHFRNYSQKALSNLLTKPWKYCPAEEPSEGH